MSDELHELERKWTERVRLITGGHKRFAAILNEMLQLHMSKCRDYGLKNLYRFGPTTQILRIIEKSSRLENYLKGIGKGVDPREELRDIAVIAVLGICLLDDGLKVKKLDVVKPDEACPLCRRKPRQSEETEDE